MRLSLPARPPFSLFTVVYSHGWVQLAPFRAIGESGAFSDITQLGSGRVLEMQVTEAPGGVAVETEEALSEPETQELSGQVTWMLGLEQDFSTFYELAAAEPSLERAAERAQGRILRSASLFEDVIKTVLTTNTTWSGTKRMVEGLVTRYGSLLPADPARHAFPTAAQLASLDEVGLRSEAKLGFRAPSVLSIARSVAEGRLDLEGLKDSRLSTEEVRKRLLAMRGVGDYAAANLLMLLGYYDYLPVDSWALKVVSREWHGGQPIGRAEVEAAFARWGEWKGLAYWCWDWTPGNG
jgi:3-methyladenine DNA glycosylase/8-oxoguanine DNA glycosylase